ncbi:MFS transporter [Microbacteriaceae bacterium VKM Ac-2855]|nr:MFS transporter [Microbacteriaceae bacterium VKM Ac-2855]
MTTHTSSTQTIDSVRPFSWKDKVGYLFGDLGNDFLFTLASSYLLIFYTNVLGLNPAHVGTLFLVMRLVDAFTDVGWGQFLDRHTPSRHGRFRPWILRAALPLVVVSALLYAPFVAEWDYGAKMVWAVVTYVLWGTVFYTMVNISYGSLASVMTQVPTQRASLSVFRGVGANLAGIFVALVPPLFLYATVDGVSQVLPSAFFTIGIVFSALALVFYVLCYSLVRERIRSLPTVDKPGFGTLLASLAGNRALISLMSANLVLILSSLLTGSVGAYLWLNYFNNGALSGVAALANVLPALIAAPFVTRIGRRWGKKELLVVLLLSSSALYFVLFLLGVTSPWVFIGISVIAGFGIGTFNLLVWAIISDVIDFQEVRTGQRDDGTVYAVNTWARKVGLGLAGGLGGYALAFIGYEAGAATQSAETIDGIYTIATLVPGVLYAVVALILLFWYPLGRRAVQSNSDELESRRVVAVS